MDYKELISSMPVVLVEYFATWCPHCRRMMPVVEEIRELTAGTAAVAQLDVDLNAGLCGAEGIDGLPTFVLYSAGREVWRHAGEIDGNCLLRKIQSFTS